VARVKIQARSRQLKSRQSPAKPTELETSSKAEPVTEQGETKVLTASVTA